MTSRDAEQEPPLAECLLTFWTEGESVPPSPPSSPDRRPKAALRRLDRPAITIRGRNLTTLLAPAYRAFARHGGTADQPQDADGGSAGR
jgi:hypothetical protein